MRKLAEKLSKNGLSSNKKESVKDKMALKTTKRMPTEMATGKFIRYQKRIASSSARGTPNAWL